MEQNFVKVYFDAEFTGLHRDTTLISIGLISESGHHFYAEFNDYNKDQIDPWLQEHVIDNLVFNDRLANFHRINSHTKWPDPIDGYERFDCHIKHCRAEIKENLLQWLKVESDRAGGAKIQFYSDCYVYDWVLLNDLICNDGKALNLPEYLYYIPVDLSTELQMYNEDPDVNREEFLGAREVVNIIDDFPLRTNMNEVPKHNSLWDAFVCKRCFEILDETYNIRKAIR